MTIKKYLLAAVGLTVAASAHAQQLAPVQPVGSTAPTVMIAPGTPMLRAGTAVPLRTVVELTTKGKLLKVGHRFELETTEAIAVNGQTVIPVGSRAMGEVTMVRNKGMWGKSGGINARLLYVRAGDRQVRLSGQLDDKGKAGGVGATAVSALVFLPAGFFMTGTSALLPVGTMVTGFLEEDVPLAFVAAAQPVPIAIPVTTPAAAAPAAPTASPAVYKPAT